MRLPDHPVVFVLGPHLDAVSGVSTHLRGLLDSRLRDEFTLVHFQVGSEGRTESKTGRVLRLIASPFRLAVAIRRRRAAIMHVNTSLNPRAFWRDLAYVIVAKLCGIRVLYQVHSGLLPQEFLGRSAVSSAFLRCMLGVPDTIVVLAESQVAGYRRLVPTQRIHVIPNAIDCTPYAALPQAPSNPCAPLELLYLGRLTRDKGLHELLEGFATAFRGGARARLTIAGTGSEEAKLRQTATTLALGGHVTFAGAVYGSEKLRLLARADVLVLPSYSEGLPYALLEGMAAGAAVIATRVGAIPDVVTEGLHGLFVPPRQAGPLGSAISALAGDRPRSSRMGAASRNHVKSNFSFQRLARSFSEQYRVLCGSSARESWADT